MTHGSRIALRFIASGLTFLLVLSPLAVLADKVPLALGRTAKVFCAEAQISLEELLIANPELLQGRSLRTPAGPRRLHQGERLHQFAKRHGVRLPDLIRDNQLGKLWLEAGSAVVLPTQSLRSLPVLREPELVANARLNRDVAWRDFERSLQKEWMPLPSSKEGSYRIENRTGEWVGTITRAQQGVNVRWMVDGVEVEMVFGSKLPSWLHSKLRIADVFWHKPDAVRGITSLELKSFEKAVLVVEALSQMPDVAVELLRAFGGDDFSAVELAREARAASEAVSPTRRGFQATRQRVVLGLPPPAPGPWVADSLRALFGEIRTYPGARAEWAALASEEKRLALKAYLKGAVPELGLDGSIMSYKHQWTTDIARHPARLVRLEERLGELKPVARAQPSWPRALPETPSAVLEAIERGKLLPPHLTPPNSPHPVKTSEGVLKLLINGVRMHPRVP